MLPKHERAASTKPMAHLQRPETLIAPNQQCCSMKGHLLPYVDINPHKTGPKWPAYIGLVIIIIITAAIVALALIRH